MCYVVVKTGAGQVRLVPCLDPTQTLVLLAFILILSHPCKCLYNAKSR